MSTSRSYGLARVSHAWRVSRAGVYRFLKGTPSPAIARGPGPTGPCPDADLADHIRREIEASDFHGEGYRKLWARLRVAGVRSSPCRVRRVMGENGLLAPHRAGRNQEKTHDGTIVTDKVNEMWGTDMSQTSRSRKGGPMFSSLSNTRTQKSSAFTPRVQPIASRRWSRSEASAVRPAVVGHRPSLPVARPQFVNLTMPYELLEAGLISRPAQSSGSPLSFFRWCLSMSTPRG